MIIGKIFVFFFPHLHVSCLVNPPGLALHRIKLLPVKIIDNAGRKNPKLLPVELKGTSNNSVLTS